MLAAIGMNRREVNRGSPSKSDPALAESLSVVAFSLVWSWVRAPSTGYHCALPEASTLRSKDDSLGVRSGG